MTHWKYPRKPFDFTRMALEDMERRSEELLAELLRRRSIRDFSAESVPRSLIERAIAAANSAPSGANRQPWHFVAVSQAEVKSRIREAAEVEERQFYEGERATREWLEALAPLATSWAKPYLETAPWLVVVFKEIYGLDAEGEKVTNYYVNESLGIACGLFIAALNHMGLVTLTHTPAPMRFLGEILDRPRNERAFILFPVGYPAEGCTVPDIPKKTLDDVTTWLE